MAAQQSENDPFAETQRAAAAADDAAGDLTGDDAGDELLAVTPWVYSPSNLAGDLIAPDPREAAMQNYFNNVREGFEEKDPFVGEACTLPPSHLRRVVDPGFRCHDTHTHKLRGSWRNRETNDGEWDAEAKIIKVIRGRHQIRNAAPAVPRYGPQAVLAGPCSVAATHLRHAEVDLELLMPFDDAYKLRGRGTNDLSRVRPHARAPAKGGWYVSGSSGEATFTQGRHYQRAFKHIGFNDHPYFAPAKSMPMSVKNKPLF
jgi:hypothetical protein